MSSAAVGDPARRSEGGPGTGDRPGDPGVAAPASSLPRPRTRPGPSPTLLSVPPPSPVTLGKFLHGGLPCDSGGQKIPGSCSSPDGLEWEEVLPAWGRQPILSVFLSA